jgi:uncharacterized membrane protein YhaH (DUF805 family)
MNWPHLYISFAGRTSKRDYWIGLGGLVAGAIVAGLLPVVGPALSLALLYPFTALLAKRLHDFGRSSWLAVIPVAPAVISLAIAMLAAVAIGDPAMMGAGLAAAGLAALLSTLAILIGIGFLIWAGTRESDAGINAYGEPTGGAVFL